MTSIEELIRGTERRRAGGEPLVAELSGNRKTLLDDVLMAAASLVLVAQIGVYLATDGVFQSQPESAIVNTVEIAPSERIEHAALRLGRM